MNLDSISIMQGRLVPREDGRYQCFPWQGWRDEFAHASEDGFDAIEFIFEQGEDEHPLLSPEGLAAIRSLSSSIWSVSTARILMNQCSKVR